LLADSGYLFLHDEHVITSYKENGGGRIPQDKRKRFNKEVAKVRIVVEHTIGMLKSRWQSVRGLRHLVRDQGTFAKLILWVRSCAVIHNMIVGRLEDDYWEGEDMVAWQRLWERQARRSRNPKGVEDIRRVTHITTEKQERMRVNFEAKDYVKAYNPTAGTLL
jgi:hypothetical protein